MLASCAELARECGVQDEPYRMLEMGQHFLKTARAKAGEGGFSVTSSQLVAVAEALVPLEILGGQKQHQQFVLTRPWRRSSRLLLPTSP